MELHTRATADACNVLTVLPATIRELRVTTPADAGRGELLALITASRSLGSLDVRDIGPRRSAATP